MHQMGDSCHINVIKEIIKIITTLVTNCNTSL